MFQHSSSPCSRRLRGLPFATLAVLFFALLIRGGALLATPGALRADPDGYRRLAENLVAHGTFSMDEAPTAYRPPLYSLLLAGCVALGDHARAAIGVLHVVLGVATVALVWMLACWWLPFFSPEGSRCYPTLPHCNGGDRAGATKPLKPKFTNLAAALAALLVAVDPILLTQSAQVMTETLAAFLATAGLAALTWTGRRPTTCRAMLAGATLALGVLCRPTLLLWTIAAGALLYPLPWATRTSEIDGRQLTAGGRIVDKFRLPAVFLFGALIVLSPWVVRNQLQFGRPIVTTTHGGYTLLLANNPEFYQWLGTGAWGSVWRADRFNAAWNQRKPHDELQADRRAYSEAWQTIRQAPAMSVFACLVRWGRFCSPLPHQVVAHETPPRRLSRYAVALWYVMEFLLAAVGCWRIISHLLLGEGAGVRAAEQGEERTGERGGESDDSAVHPSSLTFNLSPTALTLSLSQRERGLNGWLWGLLLVVCLLAAHTVYWTDMRMRAPAMPVIALAAAAGLCRRQQHA